MANVSASSPAISSTSSGISSPSGSRANTPRIYNKRPSEYGEENGLKRRKAVIASNILKTPMPTNAIVVSGDHILPGSQTVSQLGINNSLPSHYNTTQLGSFYQFPIMVQAPLNHNAILQTPNISALIAQTLPPIISTPTETTQIRLPKHVRPLVLVCVGNLLETQAQSLPSNIDQSSILKDICDAIIPTANRSWKACLSPESLAIFIVNYLTSVSNGGIVMKEVLETMLSYAKMGEQEWMQGYYHFSNNNVWKLQVSHFARLAAYQSNSNVMIMPSQISLVSGVNNALHSLADLKKIPDFIVVLYNPQGNKPFEFCVIVLNAYISKMIQEQEDRSTHGNILNVLKCGSDERLRSLLQKRNQMLKNRVLPPFKVNNLQTAVYCSEATLEKVSPQTSNIVEYQPKGPFRQQEITAMMLLKKVKDLQNSNSDTAYLSNYTNVEYYIFVPTTSTLYWQTVERLAESNLIKEAIKTHFSDERVSSITIAQNHIIKLDFTQIANPQLMEMMNFVKTNTNTLFVCVQDNAHAYTTFGNSATQQKNHLLVPNPCFVYLQLLHMPNVLSIAVTSSPISLLSSLSCIPTENEVDWFEDSDITPCIYPLGASYQDLESILEENTDIKLFEDNVFEDKIEAMCSQSKYEKNKFDVIRAQLLVQEYTIALLRLTGQTKNLNCTGDTFTMLHGLVEQPMSNNYGYGPMIVLRVHDKDVGKFVYDQLINVRKDVGLRYRFEIILDDGHQDLIIDPYFVKRMRTWKFGKQSSEIGKIQSSYFSSLMIQQSTWTPKTYLQLNNLPCILIISGKERGGETLPKSVSHYDLRLLSGISITSHTLTMDLGYIHRYVNSNKAKKRDHSTQFESGHHMCVSPTLTRHTSTPNHENRPTFDYIKNEFSNNEIDTSSNLEKSRSIDSLTQEPELTMSTMELSEQVDVSTELKKSISPAKSPNSQTSNHSSTTSHSSNEKFLIKHLTAKTEPTQTIHRMDTGCTINSDEVQDGASSGRNSVISNFSDPDINTTSLQIDAIQERTHTQVLKPSSKTIHYINNGVSVPQLSSSMPHTIKYLPIHYNPMTTLHAPSTHLNLSMNSLNSKEDNWSDVDEDDEESIGIPDYHSSFTCLLSRPYKNILTSKFATLNTRDLLPPSRDVVFEDNQDQTPQISSKDFKQISKYHRQWSKPCANHIDNVRATLIAKQQVRYPEHIASRFLLTGPPQVGKTGAYILFIKLLQDLVHSSNFVKIYDKFESEASNTLLNGASKEATNFALPKTIEILKSKFDPNAINLYQHEKLSPITYLEGNASTDYETIQSTHSSAFQLVKNHEDYDSNILENPSSTCIDVKQEATTPRYQDENSFNKLSPSKFNDSYPLKTDCFSVIQQLPDLAYAYDKSHTCAKCVAFYSRTNHVHELSYLMNNGQGPKLKFFIPHHHVASFQCSSNMVITRLVLAIYERDQTKKMNKDNFLYRTPIFTPSTGRAITGLFNLAHVLKHQGHTHIIVVNENEVNEYRKHWPMHIIMAVPDTPEYCSLGGLMELIKQFSTENYYSNERALPHSNYIIWPYILMLSDSCLMFKSTPAQIQPSTSTSNNRITLFDILKHIELDPEFNKYGAVSIRQWTSKSIPENNFSKCFLNTNFLYLHIPMLKDVHFDHFSHTCIAADITLKMLAFGIPFCRINHFSYIKKFIKMGGESFTQEACRPMKSTLLSNPKKFIGTPDSDKAYSVLYSGSYIMETFLQRAAKEIFPLASSSEYPVLEINKFLNLSENIFVSFVHEKTYQNQERLKNVKYGGLLMFSSEILQDAYFLKQFQFAQGATICLVTSDRLNLRKEITRLNLEDSWRFKLRDEFYTLCVPEKQPLYFYTGRYDVVQDSN